VYDDVCTGTRRTQANHSTYNQQRLKRCAISVSGQAETKSTKPTKKSQQRRYYVDVVEKYVLVWNTYKHGTNTTLKETQKEAKARIAILLRAAAKLDAQVPLKQKKLAVYLDQLLYPSRELVTGDERNQAIRDLAITAFWGMARLAELICQVAKGPLTRPEALLTTDVQILKIEGEEIAWLT
jgi:hypothetical protein